ncbi:hypothetical protein F511_13567 [Dorcoceras hygrometricum]|uniref:Uncharacterized protein n=1 Tax=Dorcoceras hygrometricum TaxID=472368 RepID=A0A2Z7CYJ5_9LAMI|nr:hypothetical protein F511_13567 [Dorcoceras hygrometricum]
MLNSSVLLVQADEGVLIPVVDLIRRIYRRLQFKSQISLRILVGAWRLDASKIGVAPLPPAIAFGKATSARSYNWYQIQEFLTWSPAVLTVSVVKKRCISRSAKQKMQSAVASIHQLQAISYCKQESIPAVDTIDGSAGVAEPAAVLAVSFVAYSRSLKMQAEDGIRRRCQEEQLIKCGIEAVGTITEAKSEDASRRWNQTSMSRGAADQMWNRSCWNYYRSCLYNEKKTYQLLFKVKKKRTADEQYYEENQQLSEQLLSEVLSEQLLNSAVNEEKTTAELTAVEQFDGVHSAVGTQSTFKMERING